MGREHDHLNWIIQLVEQLPVLAPPTAIQVIRSVMFLIKGSSLLRDSLIIVLRKCLYHKGTGIREVAVMGFLEIAKNMKGGLVRSSGFSQQSLSSSTSTKTSLTQVEHHLPAATSSSSSVTFSTEILSILKRTFSQEISVRLHLYQGTILIVIVQKKLTSNVKTSNLSSLYNSGMYEVTNTNRELTEEITKTLLDHFINYYETDENIIPPIMLEKCIAPHGAEMVTHEPIGHLIFILQKIYVEAADEESAANKKLSVILESLCKRMSQLELEHLQIVSFLEDFKHKIENINP